MEPDLTPYTAYAELPAHRVLVLAPHPDDEVFGCGGAVYEHVRRGVPVHVVVLTDGAKYGDSIQRATESRHAAKVLGYGEPEFWGIPDREVHFDITVIDSLVDKVNTLSIDLIYAPSPWEVHPDHRQTAMLSIAVMARVKGLVRIAFYEIGAPLRPNFLLDISSALGVKKEAMACFASQLAHQDYSQHMVALNQYRTYTLPQDVIAAEAFLLLTAIELSQAMRCGLFEPVSLGGGPSSQALAHGLPMVSVIVRGRNSVWLSETLDSIALQTYLNIEITVTAIGSGPVLPEFCGHFPLRCIATEQISALPRLVNSAIAQANGTCVLLLDEGDWLMPGHVATLVTALGMRTAALAAQTRVTLVNTEGFPLGQIKDVFANTIGSLKTGRIPMHAFLFSKVLAAQGCLFDEALQECDDAQFCQQLQQLTVITQLPSATAVHRVTASTHWLIEASEGNRTKDTTDNDEEFHRLRDHQEIAQLRKETMALREEIVQKTKHIEAFTHSTSWKVTRPLRWLSSRFHWQSTVH